MNKTALLVMDVQHGIVASLGKDTNAYLARVQKAVDYAHAVKMPVLFIVVRFRAGYPEVSPHNKSFSSLAADKSRLPLTADSEATQPVIKLKAGDILIEKKRVSAFAGSDLEVVLRSLEVTDLVLSGIATSGVVLSTLREAADKDYGLTVLADGCYDSDAEVHRVLLEKVFPRQAEVVKISEWITA